MIRSMWTEPSAHKRLLFAAGLGAVIGLSLCVFLSALLLHGLRIQLWIEGLAIALFVAALLGCAPVIALMNEYTRILRPEQRAWQRLTGLRWDEVLALTAACPPGIRVAAVGVGLLALFQCLRLGHFAVTQPGIASADVIGILAGASFFLSLCAPFLLAAAFMPTTFKELLRRRRRA